MGGWLAGVSAALDAQRGVGSVFFRDDDAGWSDDSLLRLADLFGERGVPLDLAVIPAEISAALALELIARHDGGASLGFHQHGFRHANHERHGRKCEFGTTRPFGAQRADLIAGRERLQDLLGLRLDPIFTPPWNRCTQATADALHDLGFEALSRDRGAQPLHLDGLTSLPVDVDWQRHRDGEAPDLHAIGAAISRSLRTGTAVGIMLHHAPMTAADFHALEQLLALFASHPRVRCAAMRDLLTEHACA